jgi:hypothetical protein
VEDIHPAEVGSQRLEVVVGPVAQFLVSRLSIEHYANQFNTRVHMPVSADMAAGFHRVAAGTAALHTREIGLLVGRAKVYCTVVLVQMAVVAAHTPDLVGRIVVVLIVHRDSADKGIVVWTAHRGFVTKAAHKDFVEGRERTKHMMVRWGW